MKSRDRVEAALSFEETDRPPCFATFVPEIEERLREATGIQAPDLGAALGSDLVKTCVGLERSFYGQPEPEYVCPWGIRWRYARNEHGVYTEMVEHPLAGDKGKLDAFEVPDPAEESQYDAFRQMRERYGGEKWLVGSSQISIFEACWYLRGLEQFYIDLATDPDYCCALMDEVMRFPLGAARKHAELGADMVWFGDDVSDQRGMSISLDMWRRYLKPRYAELFAAPKRVNPAIKVAYHSCGNCEEILEDMIEIGLDVLNPLQPLAIDPFEMKKRFGTRLALFGGLCVQQTMPNGTPGEVRASVRRLRSECGKGGGFILSPAHHIQADTRIENVMAFYDEALKA